MIIRRYKHILLVSPYSDSYQRNIHPIIVEKSRNEINAIFIAINSCPTDKQTQTQTNTQFTKHEEEDSIVCNNIGILLFNKNYHLNPTNENENQSVS